LEQALDQYEQLFSAVQKR